jgi:hypothetical protein
MRHFLILGGLLLAALVNTPVVVLAEDHRGEARYYDRDGRDYHNWNGDEDRQYRSYLLEHHRIYVPFVKVRVPERQEYFRYRHEHGFKIVVR